MELFKSKMDFCSESSNHNLKSLLYVGFEEDFNQNYSLNESDLIKKNDSSFEYNCKNLKNGKNYKVKKFMEVTSIEQFIINFQEIFALLRFGESDFIIKLHQIFVWEKKKLDKKSINLVIVTDLCEGGSLKERIEEAKLNNQPISEENIESYAIDLIKNFNYLDERVNFNAISINSENLFFQDKEESIIKFGIFDFCEISENGNKFEVVFNFNY